jgi:hypothetical protein
VPAKPGIHWDRKGIFHNELGNHGPIVAMVGDIKTWEGKQKAYFTPPGDQEYNVPLKPEAPQLAAAWQSAPRGQLVMIQASGRDDDASGTIIFTPVAPDTPQACACVGPMQQQPITPPQPVQSAPQPAPAVQTQAGPGMPPQAVQPAPEKRLTELFPWPSIADRTREALSVAADLTGEFADVGSMDAYQIADLMWRLANGMLSGQGAMYNRLGHWVPLALDSALLKAIQQELELRREQMEKAKASGEAPAAEVPRAKEGQLAAIRALLGQCMETLTTEAREAIESGLASTPAPSHAWAEKTVTFLTQQIAKL